MWTYHCGFNPSSSNMDTQRGNLLIYGFFASNIFRQRNPSWIWIRYVQHAFHKHHKNLLCRSESHFALDTPSSHFTSGHINGDNAYSPQLPDTQNYTVTLNTSLTRPTTRCHLNIPLSYRVSKTNKPNHNESCSTKNKPPQSCK